MTEAARLAQGRSVGLVDNVTIGFANTSVDLKGMFPQQIVDTQITEQTGTLKATAREFSRRNIDIMLGNAVSTDVITDVKTTLVDTADVAANAVTFDVISAAGLAVDDVIVIYPEGKPEDVTVSQIASIAVNAITLKTGMGTLVAYPALADSTREYHVFKAHGVAAGNVTKTNYFTASVIQQKSVSGRPLVWLIWKAANTGSMEQGTSATDYASLAMDYKILAPSNTDVGVGGSLNNVASLIELYPMGARIGGADQ